MIEPINPIKSDKIVRLTIDKAILMAELADIRKTVVIGIVADANVVPMMISRCIFTILSFKIR